MYEDGWNRFTKTGQIKDYLEYKQESERQYIHCHANDKTGEVREVGYAGLCNCDRNHN